MFIFNFLCFSRKPKVKGESEYYHLKYVNANNIESKTCLCLFAAVKIISTHNDSDEQRMKDREKFEKMKSIVDEGDTLKFLNYPEGRMVVYKDGKEIPYELETKGPVDMDCVKEAIIQLNEEKKIPIKKLPIIERVITDGFIGSGKEKMTTIEFMNYLKQFMHVTSSTYYAGRFEKGMLKTWMGNNSEKRKKEILFAKDFIRKYSELKETKL